MQGLFDHMINIYMDLPNHETSGTVWDTPFFQRVIDRSPSTTAATDSTAIKGQDQGDNSSAANTCIPPEKKRIDR